MEIKYFVRTLEGRECDLPEYVERIIDYEHKYVKSYIDALYKINDCNAVLMEDDIVLCKNFREEIEKVINKYPNNIINFFTSPSKYYTSHFSSMFIYNQCTYFPKGMTKFLADEIMKMYIPEEPGKHSIQRYGSLLNIVLCDNNIPHLIHRPCLVQHIDAKSTRDAWCGCRNTPYFKDYLDAVGITMEEAFDRQNLDKLNRLLAQDREKWYKDIKKS
jgi:hypothetical protein